MRPMVRPMTCGFPHWVLPLLLVMSIPYFCEPRPSLPDSPESRTSPRTLHFLSSNTEDGLTLGDAERRLESPRHEHFRRRAEALAIGAGMRGVHVFDALGDWSDGVENSLLVQSEFDAGRTTLREVAARFGLEARQKSVLVFHADEGGRDETAFLELPPTALPVLRNRLDAHGILFRTIVRTRDGIQVVVLDQQKPSHARIEQAAKALHGRVQFIAGESLSLGADDREAARQQFRSTIREVEQERLRRVSDRSRQRQRQRPPLESGSRSVRRSTT